MKLAKTLLSGVCGIYKLDAAKYHEAVVIFQQVIVLAHMGHSISHAAIMEANKRDSADQMRGKLATTVDVLEVPVTKLSVRDLQSAEDAGRYRAVIVLRSRGCLRPLDLMPPRWAGVGSKVAQ